MIGQSLSFVCMLVISFIAIGSNLVVITSDTTTNENPVKRQENIIEVPQPLKSLIHKRDTFDEYGNLDLHYKASTKESTVWFKFSSPTPPYHLYEAIDDIRKDIKPREQVQGLKHDNAHYIYENVKSPSSKPEISSSSGIRYIGCYSTWEKQFTIFESPYTTQKYDDSQNHVTCAYKCRLRGADMQISFLKGAECYCAPIYGFDSQLKPHSFCNIPCPIKDFPSSVGHFVPPGNPCGGNQGYSVYCMDAGPGNCSAVQEEARRQLAAGQVQQESLPGSEIVTKPRPVAVLKELCTKCDYSREESKECFRQFKFPDFDYFPVNSPERCVEYCSTEVPYVILGGQEKLRQPTQYALLMWSTDPNDHFDVPICRCVNEGIRKMFSKVNTALCDKGCPGKPSNVCGGKQRGSLVYATVYCVDWGNGKCDETSVEEPCTEDDIDCDSTTTTTPKKEETTYESTTITEDDTTTTEKYTIPTTNATTVTTTNATSTTTSPTTTIKTTPSPSTTTTTTPTTTPTSTTTRPPTTTPFNASCNIKCQAVDRNGYYWNVCAGVQAIVRCSDLNKNSNATGLAFWRCSADGKFETLHPNVSNCSSVWLEDKHDQIEKIRDIVEADAYVNNLAEACRNAKSPNSTSRYYGHEIRDITSLVELTVLKAREFLNESTFSELESVIDKAVDLNAFLIQYHDPWRDLPLPDKSAISTDIIDNTEEALFHLTHEVNDENYMRIFTMNSTEANKFLILAETIDKRTNALNKSYEFPPRNGRNEQDSYIKLPPGWGNLVTNKQIEIAAMSIDSEFISSIMSGQYDNLVSSSTLDEGDGDVKLINGRLMSLTLMPSETHQVKHLPDMNSIINRPTMSFNGKGVEITFHHDIEAWGDDIRNVPRSLHEGEQPKAVLGTSKCVYWDTKTLSWSSHGCTIVRANRYETVCECNHLTSFAVLMDVHRYVGKQFGLELLTLILCPASEVALVVSIIILSSVSGLQRIRATITNNLSACLLVGNALVLFVLDRDYFNMNEGVCMGAAMVTHYIFLCAFMWMLIEGVQLYRMVVHVFDSGRSYIKHFGIFAYGSPLIVIAITATTGYLKGDKPYGGDVYCWLQGSYIWSFMGPVAVITTVNLIILFIALKTAYQVQQNKKSSPVFIMGKIRSYKTWFKGCFSLTVILGLTWIVGFFTLMKSPGGIIAAYIFTILNASQGLFIFFFNCVFNEKVRSFTQRNLSTYLPSWMSSSGSSNPGGNDGSIYGKRPLSSMKSGDSVLHEKAKRRHSSKRQISNPIEIKGSNKHHFAKTIDNDTEPTLETTRRLPRTTKVGFAEAKNIFISDTPRPHVTRFESTGTISSLDSIPNSSSASETGHISSDSSQNILISKERF